MKIVQISATECTTPRDDWYGSVYALTDDGNIYTCRATSSDAWEWKKEPLPNFEEFIDLELKRLKDKVKEISEEIDRKRVSNETGVDWKWEPV